MGEIEEKNDRGTKGVEDVEDGVKTDRFYGDATGTGFWTYFGVPGITATNQSADTWCA